MASYSELGRRPEKSSFSLTCSLLSQYIKEKGCPADLGLGRPIRSIDPSVLGKPEAYRPPTTMCLLPGVDVSGNDNAGAKDDDLMQLASKGSGPGVQNFSLAPPSAAADLPSCPAPPNPPTSFPPRPQPSFSDLPIARKASLHRFLEKRKERIIAKAPYQLSSKEGSKDAVSVKQEDICQPWLGLGPQISNCSR